MALDRDEAAIGLGLEAIAGLELGRAGSDRRRQDGRKLGLVGRD